MGSYSPGAERRCLGEDALRAIRPPPCEACLSLPASLSVLRARSALKARAQPPLCTLNQPLPFAKLRCSQASRARPGCERQRRARGRGALGHRRGQSPLRPPRPLCSLFPTFPDGTADAPAGRSPKVPGTAGEAPTAMGNRVLASPTTPLAARLGSLGIYIILLFYFFSGETVLCFLVWFRFVGFLVFYFSPPSVEKREAFFYMPISTIDILIYLL